MPKHVAADKPAISREAGTKALHRKYSTDRWTRVHCGSMVGEVRFIGGGLDHRAKVFRSLESRETIRVRYTKDQVDYWPGPMTRTEIVSGSILFGTLREKWQELSQDSSAATPFQSAAWQQTWMKHYGGAKTPLALALFEGEDLVGLATFVLGKGIWRTLRWMGGGPSDYLHPIARRGFEGQVEGAVREFLHSAKGFDLIDLHQVRESIPHKAWTASEPIVQANSLVLDLPGTFEEYLGTLGKSLRYDVRKLGKEMFKTGKARMDIVGIEDVNSGFEIFLDQHRRRWRERRLPGAFVGRSLKFHREWIHQGTTLGVAKLKILRLEGAPVGAIYAMEYSGVLYYYQAGFDPEYKSISPGTLLVADCIREGIEAGMKRFDFMRGDEPYKRRWKPQNSYQNLRLVESRSGLTGKFGFEWNRKAHDFEMNIRSRLEGGG